MKFKYSYSLFLIIVISVLSCSKSIRFDSGLWKNPQSYSCKEGDRTDRQKMIKNVLETIRGKSKNEVILLLGPSLKTSYFKGTGRDLIYLLGPEQSFFSIDSEWLLVFFDENNMYKKHSIMTD